MRKVGDISVKFEVNFKWKSLIKSRSLLRSKKSFFRLEKLLKFYILISDITNAFSPSYQFLYRISLFKCRFIYEKRRIITFLCRNIRLRLKRKNCLFLFEDIDRVNIIKSLIKIDSNLWIRWKLLCYKLRGNWEAFKGSISEKFIL